MAENQSTVENAKEKLDRWLKDGITTPGGKLPSERELGELLGIKRMTLRQALLNLEAESKIFRKDRKGWFVTQPRFNYSPELSASFQRAAIEQGREPSWGFTEKNRTSDIPETLAPLIAVTPSTELYRITGWGALEGHKVFYHETYINPEVAPGFIETDMTRALSDDQRAGILAQVPAGRLGGAQEIANAVAFLASDEAAYITGETLHVNGGMYMV